MQEESLIADRLQELRRRYGKTQTEFATSIDVTPRAYKNYEYSISEPPLSMIKSIVQVYEEDPIWLIFGISAERKKPTIDEFLKIANQYLDISEDIQMPRDKKLLLLESMFGKLFEQKGD